VKHRKWYAFVSASAAGPEFTSRLEEEGRFLRPRMAADLRYTTADARYLADVWARPSYDSAPHEEHIRVVNPTRSALLGALSQAGEWLRAASTHADWDGGGLTFCYAGHGRDTDGALVLDDGETLTSEELGEVLSEIAGTNRGDHNLRVVILLDSCYAGAFVTDFLSDALHVHRSLYPYYLAGGCMPDEVAWEESSLGHGLFTYCWSVRPSDMFTIGALAAQPDNTDGPSITLASGPTGCALLTAGEQNPVVYVDYHIQSCGHQFAVLPHHDPNLPRPLVSGEIRERLLANRSGFQTAVHRLPLGRSVRGQWSDAEMKQSLTTLVRQLDDWRAGHPTRHVTAPSPGLFAAGQTIPQLPRDAAG
jgi:Caspase domain